MFFSALLERFVKQAPIAVMAQATIAYALNATFLDRLFQEQASTQYERQIPFSALVDLMSLVVCQIYRSVNSGYKKSKAKLKASLVAVYGKLKRINPHYHGSGCGHGPTPGCGDHGITPRVIFPCSGISCEDCQWESSGGNPTPFKSPAGRRRGSAAGTSTGRVRSPTGPHDQHYSL